MQSTGSIPHPAPLNALEADVVAARGGDRDAFGRLVTATQGTVCAIALAIVRDVEASKDIAQEVFLAAWKGLRSLRNPASFLPWIRQTTRYRARTWRRNDHRAAARRAGDDSLLASIDDPRPDPQTLALRAEEAETLASALAELSAETREVVTLFYREGQSIRQVATLLELSPDAVKQRLSRARHRLRDDVLDRLGRALAVSGPGLAFTTTVMTALSTAAPPAGAAIGAASAAKVAGSSTAWKLATGAFGGAAFGATSAVLAVVAGLRGDLKEAADEGELQDLRHLRMAAIIGVVVAALGLPALALWTMDWRPPTALYVTFLLYLGGLYLVWLPRIQARRHALERVADPDAHHRHRRRRRQAWIGFSAGALCGGLGLFASLVHTSLI
ncbi:MAG: sigma-70 family RNA polymerase sigma factor [Acidobacteriota bacterium]